MSHPHTPQKRAHAGIRKIAHQTHTTNHHPKRAVTTMRARCSQPLSTNQTPHPTTKVERQQPTLTQRADPTLQVKPPPVSQPTGQRGDGLVVSKPNSVSGNPITGVSPPAQRLSCTRTTPTTGVAHPSNRPSHGDPQHVGRLGSRGAP